jgi:hypothetical protein
MRGGDIMGHGIPYRKEPPMSDTTYEIIKDGDEYKVQIKRLGHFVHEAGGFTSIAEARSWAAQDERFAARDEQREPMAPPHLRVV